MQKLSKNTQKVFIRFADSIEEADAAVRKFSGFEGELIEDYKGRIKYLKKLFRLKKEHGIDPDGSSEFDILKTDYYTMLTWIMKTRNKGFR